jgi:hypothetical protein
VTFRVVSTGKRNNRLATSVPTNNVRIETATNSAPGPSSARIECHTAAKYLPILALAIGCHHAPDPTEPPPPPALPEIRVDHPERGAFVRELAIDGEVLPGDGAITSFTVNDAEVPLDHDAFATTLAVPAGMAILSTRVEDDLDQRAVDGRAVQVGPVWAPGATIPGALTLQLGPELLDDDDPDIDDLASIGARIAEDPSFTQAIVGQTYVSDYYTLEITGVHLASADMDLDPGQGILYVETRLYDVDTTFDADVVDFVTVSGSSHADVLTLDLELAVGTDASGITVTARSSTAHMTGFSFEVEWVPSWVEDLLKADVKAKMEDELAAQARDQIGGLVGDALAGFGLDTNLGERDEVHLSMEPTTAEVVPQGLIVGMDAAVTARTAAFALPDRAGSVRTDDDPPSMPIATDQPFAAEVDDDFLNAVLFAFWAAGDLGGIEVDGTELALMSGSELPAPLGPVAHATIDAGLPPVVMAPSGELTLDLAVGELVIDITRDDGEQVTASLSIRAPAELVQVDSGGLSMTVDDRPSFVTVAAGMLATPEGLDPGDVASLFRLSAPTLLGRSSSLFPAFPAPSLPVGDFVDVPSLRDTTLGLDDLDVRMTDGNFVVMTGRMIPQ